MALLVTVIQERDAFDNHLTVQAKWENGRVEMTAVLVPRLSGMTAAESVEYFMLLNTGMVASWTWSASKYVNVVQRLHGQFVYVGSAKEVSNSDAHLFDF